MGSEQLAGCSKRPSSKAAARRTASRISDATLVRAGEMVSRQCLEAKRHLSHPPAPSCRSSSFPGPYVEPLSEARTPLADFFNILLYMLDTQDEMGRWSRVRQIHLFDDVPSVHPGHKGLGLTEMNPDILAHGCTSRDFPVTRMSKLLSEHLRRFAANRNSNGRSNVPEF
jgi:hypothetical protein